MLPSFPSPRPTGSPLALIWGLFAVTMAGLALGVFVLPNLPQARARSVASGGPVAVTADVSAAMPTTDLSAIEPPANSAPKPADPPKPPAFKPHPLDAAPVVIRKLPAGVAYDLVAVIHREIDAALAAAKIPAAPLADDAAFLRRVTLDLTGTIPTYEQTLAFLLDGDPYKRAKRIDALLDSPAYGRHFAHEWADLLIKRDFDSNKRLNTEPFVSWLAGRFNENEGWDKIVMEMLTAQGKDEDTPQNLFFAANQDNNQPSPAKLVGASANLFMGIQLQCSECHVHPHVDKWSQKDFWGMAAFFGHVRAERSGDKAAKQGGPATLTEVERKAEPKGKAAKKNGDKAIAPGAIIAIPDPTDNKKTTGTAKAKFFEGASPALTSVPYRPKLAAWLASSQDKYFAPAAVNRAWAHFFARGFVHPIEEMHPENPASHPAVLKALADDFTRSKYDLKHLIRVICNTTAYQRTSRPLPDNASDDKLYSRMPVKVIGARELLDALTTATGYQEESANDRQVMRPAPQKGFAGPVSLVRFFDTREYDDDTTEYAYGVPQVLKLMNTNLTHRATEATRRIEKTAAGDRRRVIEDLYLTALTRRPRPDEIERMNAFVSRQSDASKGYAGVFWALLNSAEFVSNH